MCKVILVKSSWCRCFVNRPHLLEPALSCVVQGSPAGAVGHVQVAQLGQQGLGAARGTVGGGHVQRRLPELVSCVRLRSAPQQQTHRPLGGGTRSQERLKTHTSPPLQSMSRCISPQSIFSRSHVGEPVTELHGGMGGEVIPLGGN